MRKLSVAKICQKTERNVSFICHKTGSFKTLSGNCQMRIGNVSKMCLQTNICQKTVFVRFEKLSYQYKHITQSDVHCIRLVSRSSKQTVVKREPYASKTCSYRLRWPLCRRHPSPSPPRSDARPGSRRGHRAQRSGTSRRWGLQVREKREVMHEIKFYSVSNY